VAYGIDSAGARIVVVADGPGGTEKEVAVVPGALAFDDVVWSSDGRWIAASAYVGTSPRDYTIKVLVVGVTPDGDVATPARLIDTPIIFAAWGLRWLPDGSAVTLTGQSPPYGRFDAWWVPVRDDGRHVAYRARVERGTSLWLADLGEALRGLNQE
jgi:hypothetical protein